MDLDIEGNAALVTASSSGLGKASARALAREGADVVVNGRDPDRLETAAEDIRADAAGEVVPVRGDLTDPADCEALVEAAVEAFGRLDHLVTSAGGPPPLRTLETDDEDWYDAFDLLVMSVVRLAREAAPHLREAEGSMACIASRTVKENNPGNVLSSSVRMGVIGLEKTLSRELAPEVRVNAVLPGAHETPRIREIFEDEIERGEHDSIEAAREAWSANVPVGRIGDPMELGDTVAYLCSPRAGFVSGETVLIDGGSSVATL